MTYEERKAQVRAYLGKVVTIGIDRPIGYVHQKKDYALVYPINSGYIPGVLGGDGEELDVYLLGVREPVESYTGRIVGIVHREDDVEDKLIMAPEGVIPTAAQIADAIRYLLEHPEEARQMGENGRRAVKEEFNWGGEEKKLLALYEDILKN